MSPRSVTSSPDAWSSVRIFQVTLVGLALLLAWDFSGLDLTLARWFGSSTGFALEGHWFWRDLLHDRIKGPLWLLELVLLVGIFKPFGPLKLLATERRTQLAVTTLGILVVISSLKLQSKTSCPWSLQEFGGAASYVSHWAWGQLDGGGGNCFPAGHASAGFAFLGGFFALRHTQPKMAAWWLATTIFMGVLLGLAQQVRGAHFMSHTLWTAWISWTIAAVVDVGVTRLLARKKTKKAEATPATAC